eukprot:Skav207993  [mRNA]  locus=scaffold1203:117451:118130:+ [translate_table: standard]
MAAAEPVPITDAAPVASAVQMGTAMPMTTTYPMEQMVTYTTDPGYVMEGGAPMYYYPMPGAESIGAYPATTYVTGDPMMAYGGLDHSQGKWFAPGEMLPPGYVVTAHPEGHVAPQEGHLMSDQATGKGSKDATKARESFVITTGAKTGASAPKAKKSKKKKSSGCC